MGKGHWTPEGLVLETVSAVAALVYTALQVYYGIVYAAGAMRILMNIFILLAVYAAFTLLAVYPERVNNLTREACSGKVRIYTVRMVRLIKLVFVLSLLFTSICDALGVRVDAAYSLIAMGLIIAIAVVCEVKIIRILRGGKK